MIARLLVGGLAVGLVAVASRGASFTLTNGSASPIGASSYSFTSAPLTMVATASLTPGGADMVGQSNLGLGVIGTSGLPNYIDVYPTHSVIETLTMTFSTMVTLNSLTLFTLDGQAGTGTQYTINGTAFGPLLSNGDNTVSPVVPAGTTFAFSVKTGVNDTQWFYSIKSVTATAVPAPLPAAVWGGMGMLGLMGMARVVKRQR
jgi:hypothetical protein